MIPNTNQNPRIRNPDAGVSHIRGRRSVDLDHDFHVFAHGGGTHHDADRLGDASLLADDAAHILLGDVKVEHLSLIHI